LTADLLSLEIADVNFVINCNNEVTVHTPPPVYRPFLDNADAAKCSLIVRVTLELRDMPEVKNMTKIFDSGESWSMYRHLDEYILTLNPSVLDNQTVWMARISGSSADVTVYCSDMLKVSTEGRAKVLNPVLYPLDQLLLIHILAQKDGALVHAAGVHFHERGYVFLGRSGAGKSTISNQFAERKLWGLLSDDRIAIRKMNNTFMAYGTPWAGEAGIAENRGTTLSGLFFLRQGPENMIKEITPGEAFERLMPVTSVPWYDEAMMTKVLSFCEEMVARIPSFDLFFRPDTRIVDLMEEYAAA
jgi:hypothetical protein